MGESTDDIRLALLKSAAENYKRKPVTEEGPITGDTLDITTKSGWAGFVTAIVAAIGAIVAATQHVSPAITVGAMGLAGIAAIALALVIQSDHAARAAVTVAMVQMAPGLIAASQTASSVSISGASDVATTVNAHFLVMRPGLKAELKNDDENVDVFALRLDTKGDSTTLTYLVGRPGHSDMQWKSQADVSRIL